MSPPSVKQFTLQALLGAVCGAALICVYLRAAAAVDAIIPAVISLIYLATWFVLFRIMSKIYRSPGLGVGTSALVMILITIVVFAALAVFVPIR